MITSPIPEADYELLGTRTHTHRGSRDCSVSCLSLFENQFKINCLCPFTNIKVECTDLYSSAFLHLVGPALSSCCLSFSPIGGLQIGNASKRQDI
jgi:hypothetical protein